MMERDSGVDFAQRTEAKPFFFRANGLNKTLCLVRIKSKSIEEREKTKKKKKKEEINQSNHILLLLTREIDTVAFFFLFPTFH